MRSSYIVRFQIKKFSLRKLAQTTYQFTKSIVTNWWKWKQPNSRNLNCAFYFTTVRIKMIACIRIVWENGKIITHCAKYEFIYSQFSFFCCSRGQMSQFRYKTSREISYLTIFEMSCLFFWFYPNGLIIAILWNIITTYRVWIEM